MLNKIRPFLLFLCCLAVNTVHAQNWGGGVDDDNLHFGFTFQYLASEFKILKKDTWQQPFINPETGMPVSRTLRAISSVSSPGFGIGFVVNKRLGENADLRLTPTLVFNDRLAYYDFEGEETPMERKVQSTMIDLPLGIKIKSDRRNNFRAYVLGGAKYSMDIASKKRNNDAPNAPMDKFLKNVKNFLSYEAGFGCDLYFEYFKMSPEIKLSYSLNNILKNDPSPYSAPIDRLMLRHVTFSLFFE
ncbi:MAG: outer membrane beta-barrel protein [Candidatus Pedobacter colombiensis]|uniref:Outer membrane beta-barrel protein n=1 Tax=Candidatus Pedobacter colombiensis TaxID=3121371 RepID=A0AAJ5WAL7_9SPHI|nr:outer membrane beta-barrel protein [Pedobacter sp.]WEK20126.1 MAG: outer membrane beta-barrel protein [Pedobacter sp.]